MADEISLADVIADAVAGYYGAGESPALVSGFITAVAIVDDEGRPGLVVAYPETQDYARSLGLIAFADEYVRDDVRIAFDESRGER